MIRGAFDHAAVCVDRSEAARRALAEARRLRPERLSVVHAGGGPEARRWLEELAGGIPGAEAVHLAGPPAERLIGWARAARPDVLIAASRSGLVARALGSTARRLAGSAPCPVLILPPEVEPGAAPSGRGEAPYADIACCIDDSEASRRALSEARRLRALGPGTLSLVHVAPRPLIEEPPPGAPPSAPRDVAFDERDWLMATAAAVPGAVAVPLQGGPEAAVAWARTTRPDLMVAGARDRSPVERALLGSFAAHLAREAPCPALLTR